MRWLAALVVVAVASCGGPSLEEACCECWASAGCWLEPDNTSRDETDEAAGVCLADWAHLRETVDPKEKGAPNPAYIYGDCPNRNGPMGPEPGDYAKCEALGCPPL